MDEGASQSIDERTDPGPEPWISSETTSASRASAWSNGQCVLVVPASSFLFPSFDLTLCRGLLEKEGFQIPVEDFEIPLRSALDPPSIRRYLFFNSSLFHFILALIIYVVLWCAVFSSVHLYLRESAVNFWLLCLCVTLVTIFITIIIILVFYYNNKEININTDVRLMQVNERLVTHSLLLGVADWIEKCTGKMQLCCVFWDLGPCLQALTETLEELDLVRDEIQNKLKKRMSHLVLMAEVRMSEDDAGSDGAEPDEECPLLVEGGERRTSSRQRDEFKLTQSFSLVPDLTLSCQTIAHQLLMIYSAAYVKLLISEGLPCAPRHPIDSVRNHCTTASLCLCQYVQYKLLK
ncbi:transmembrane protein 268 [Trichomycterus rosablanca]|uniref:transmembrane protein 268 n=1 Tax=Trichomycterus rosablanca TaxID=2290929 RepID=UPI002F353972